jgi:hypothetical protein
MADKRTMSSPNIKTAMARTICVCVSVCQNQQHYVWGKKKKKKLFG